MLENGKIFVVVAVLALILVGVFVYLFSIDRKVTKLEKEVKERNTESER
jgi:CcmD family protein